MDFQEMITNKVSAMRQEELKDMPILTLGEIVAKLEAIEAAHTDKEDFWVRYDFGSLTPTKLMSWRGVYAELALGYEDGKNWPKITDVLDELKSGIGKTFEGYKGGDFKMGRGTPVWVANYGDSGNTAIVDILDNSYEAIIITSRLER